MPSTLTRILEETEKTLRRIPFAVEAGDHTPPIQSISVWKSDVATASEANWPHVETPGLIITPPRSITAPEDAGTNVRDDVVYPILIQIVSGDPSDRSQNIATYSRWLEQIRRAFHARSWPEIDPQEFGDVRASFATTTDFVNQKIWVRHRKFVSGVAVVFYSREPRR